MNSDILEYELVDISFELPYELPEEGSSLVREGDTIEKNIPHIEYDTDGVPMGNTRDEIEMRREMIHEYIQQWRAQHKDNPYVYNDSIKESIKVNQTFMLESVNHAVGSYKSTKAVLRFEEVMAKARRIGETKTKEGNSNQRPFQRMMVMHYRIPELGDVKMTVGIRKVTKEKVEYSITVPPPGTSFIEKSINSGKNSSRKRKKRS